MHINKVEKIFNNMTKSKHIYEGFLLIENLEGDFSYTQSYGERDRHTPMLMASVTKLFTTTCILVLMEQGKVALEDKIATYLDEGIIKGLHCYKGKDCSSKYVH